MSKQDVSVLIGQKMLLGWTLLDVVCSKCSVVPLVEDKKNNVILCMGCNRRLKRENGDIIQVTPGDSESTTSNNNKNNNNNTSNNNNVNHDNMFMPGLLRTNNNQDNHNNNNNKVEKQTIITDKMDIVGNDDNQLDYDEDEDDDEVLWTEDERIQFEKRMKKSDETSAKIGQKLLMGWTLLGDVCPNTECFGSPLMRDREKVYHCLSCDRTEMNADDFHIPKQQQQQQKNIINTNGNVNNTVSEISPTKEPILKKQKKEEQSHVHVPEHSAYQQQSLNHHTVPSSSFSRSSSGSSINSNNQHNNYNIIPVVDQHVIANNRQLAGTPIKLLHQNISEMPEVVDRTLSTLFTKLKETELHLSDSNNINDTRNDCILIKECSQAISSLLELKKQYLS
ncbi:Sjogrens syndrome scleroderma autoantigen 1 family protein [Heterostelium album PN500]|uniref:Sjogrens syndrome scleroderma autoantigen 1 family protein n=1 Tax=Heterostelium pallidum (strain ATCC 26659 / Pp 5 / PN500) TaxID=670386 RepID=D3BFR7_HETP5|nr:Sjogrens syndrome scleroderma autoantigen 1 family protein [Heterostelium album PN500]EFA79677.1 Sjogrens syndrome scleroderma autoantigen 1 family protein [Heterostelium album PN500]|eukprot:XP_020431798.1 Sjogrens syndrome scleroderma autoantigen 1 family protein [Heterostelium album PN500]